MFYEIIMKKKYFLIVLTFFGLMSTFAQTAEEAKKIVANYDLNKIKERQAFYEKQQRAEKAKALEAAKLNNWPIIIKGKNGSISELMKLSPEGLPIYYSTDNINAARSTRANHLNTGGSLGLTLDGQGMVARVWDGGTVRRTHNSLNGRLTTVDDDSGITYSQHATHVTGTVMASTAIASIKGMASQATGRTFNWTDDESEALAEVQLGMLLSNHSYGVPVTSTTGVTLPAWAIGSYTNDARTWDEIAYISPYYLPVKSAGNSGSDENNAEPLSYGYDKLTGDKTAKNSLIIANAQDAIVDASGNLTSVIINSSSSQGPADDFRIKPDLTGNGTALLSSSHTSNTATASLTGTSMASPNVMGTLLLVQQHYKNVTNNFMRAAALKGLACHTADDAGSIGPDPNFGWGLLNAKKAVETINGNGLTTWLSEEKLNQGQTYVLTVKSNGTSPLVASITWTDVPGVANNGTLPANDPTPALVNDLDIRVTKSGTTYYPWKLDASLTAINTGDNNVDNVEQVQIDTPTAGDYTITVTHKGTLVSGGQNYALVVTGLTSPFAVTSTSDDLLKCSNETATFNFNYKQTGVGTTNFTATGLPSGATASFSNNSLSANGNVSMTINGLTNAIPGEYLVGIVGNNGTETETRYKTLKVYSSVFQNVTAVSPTDGLNGLATSVNLKWNKQFNATSYDVQASTSSSFSTFLFNDNVTTDNYTISGLNQETKYYWRVIPKNSCGAAVPSTSTVFNFFTGLVNCATPSFVATDFSSAAIASTANATATVPVTVTGGYTVGDLNVNLAIAHTYIQDMTITLEGPASIGSPKIILFKEVCGNNDNMNCIIDDSGILPTCTGAGALTGTVKPFEDLLSLNALPADGVWKLIVSDPYNGDGGAVTDFSLNICNITPSALSVEENILARTSIYPNPTNGVININLPDTVDNVDLFLYDLQGRQILRKSTNSNQEFINIENFQEGVYLLTIKNDKFETSKKIVLTK
jgi:subtilisin-like proprotein convertase family protein